MSSFECPKHRHLYPAFHPAHHCAEPSSCVSEIAAEETRPADSTCSPRPLTHPNCSEQFVLKAPHPLENLRNASNRLETPGPRRTGAGAEMFAGYGEKERSHWKAQNSKSHQGFPLSIPRHCQNHPSLGALYYHLHSAVPSEGLLLLYV